MSTFIKEQYEPGLLAGIFYLVAGNIALAVDNPRHRFYWELLVWRADRGVRPYRFLPAELAIELYGARGLP